MSTLRESIEDLLKSILEKNKENTKDNEQEEKEFHIDTCSDRRFVRELEKIYDSAEKHTDHLKEAYKVSPIIASYLWAFNKQQTDLLKAITITRLFGK